jgi:hypothetical protein
MKSASISGPAEAGHYVPSTTSIRLKPDATNVA